MRVMGVDPGTIRMGVGVVESISGDLVCRERICIAPRRSDPIELRLIHLFDNLKQIIEKANPDVIAVEEPFVSKNPRTAIAIGQAQAVVLVAAATYKIPISRYAPMEIKKSVTDYGGSSKEQVKSMVSILLGNIDIDGPSDVSDALAIAICHHSSTMLNNLVME